MHPYGSTTDAYRTNAVLSATPEQLVVLLYDAAVRFLRQAEHGLRQGDQRLCSEKLDRVEAIIDELLATLDVEAGGELAQRLQAIYVWCRRCLVEARAHRDADRIAHVTRLVDDLRGSWARIAQGASAPA